MFSLTLPLLALVAVAPVLATPLQERASTYPILSITDAQWAKFNATVGGRLHRGFPVARPCYARAGANVVGSFDKAQCDAVQAGNNNDLFIIKNFGGYMNTNWGACQATGQQCQLDFNAPMSPVPGLTKVCEQGSVSTYYVDVAFPSDVQAIFAFANSTKVPLAIKNTGHDYKGRSSAPFSLGIWTHNLVGITHQPAFVGAGCPSTTKANNGVTYAAGTAFLELYKFAEANNITILGGSSMTVGAAGGWLQGGGHGALSNSLGLGVDRVLEIKVVTPDGKYLTANDCQNTDLFFALRGGGGGTFGVVMETTTTAAPAMRIQVAYIRYTSLDPNSLTEFMKIIIANSQKWADEGWGGYIAPGAISSQVSGYILFTPALTNAQATLSMKPITDFVGDILKGNVALSSTITEESTFFEAYSKFIIPNEELVGLGVALASRFVPTDNFLPKNQPKLLESVLKAIKLTGTNLVSGGLVYGGIPTQILVTTPINYKQPSDRTTPTSVTPAWKNTLWHILFIPTFGYTASPTEISAAFQKAATAVNFIRAITPPGAYQNEADIHEGLGANAVYGSHIDSFWGAANYAKLLAIKKKVDPDGLLSCWQCVGWNETDRQTNPRFSCYP